MGAWMIGSTRSQQSTIGTPGPGSARWYTLPLSSLGPLSPIKSGPMALLQPLGDPSTTRPSPTTTGKVPAPADPTAGSAWSLHREITLGQQRSPLPRGAVLSIRDEECSSPFRMK
ncbi:hypothetical protein NDU88_004164 [Pleurodeles waltl]|uniref:Uncharacterized protein n=1 Tax=Pleurodeles waltl TaxID=8319 RepID=A0AAV7LHA8_PLEWA|nr:hypothetical protein NDU88_004164 [Pleurodeles waltl]